MTQDNAKDKAEEQQKQYEKQRNDQNPFLNGSQYYRACNHMADWSRSFTLDQVGEEWKPVTKDLPQVGEYKILWINGTWLKGKRLHDGWKVLFADKEQDFSDGEYNIEFYMDEPQPPITK